jgi:hypothetical protein
MSILRERRSTVATHPFYRIPCIIDRDRKLELWCKTIFNVQDYGPKFEGKIATSRCLILEPTNAKSTTVEQYDKWASPFRSLVGCVRADEDICAITHSYLVVLLSNPFWGWPKTFDDSISSS